VRRKLIVEVRLGRRETGGPPGEAKERWSRGGGQSERPKKERQSGVVKVDISMRGEVH
jgi:hypothetical protein